MSRKKLLLFLLLASPASFAQTWTLPMFTSDPAAVLAAAARFQAPEGTPALIIDYSVSAQIDAAGNLLKVTRMVTKVLRVQGISAVQDVSLYWSLARENRPIVRARIITSDGQAHLLDEKTIAVDEPDNPNAIGTVKLLRMTLPQVDLDSVVELEVQVSRHDSFPGASFGDFPLQPGLPIAHFKMAISSASDSALMIDTRDFPEAKVSQQPAPGGHAVTVEAANFQPRLLGDFLPPETAPVPTVSFTNVPSWQAIASWYAGVVNRATKPESPARAGTSDDRLANIENIYEEMRKHIKDSGLDLSVAVLAPRTPSETLKAAIANSNDEGVYLISKLAEAGIPAKLALISTGPGPDILPKDPGIEVFNRALVYVPGTTPLWIDPTAEFTPVFRLPIADQQRWALIIDPSTTELVHTPGSSAKDNVDIVQTEIHIGDGYPTKILEKVDTSGVFQDALRPFTARLAAADEEGKQKLLYPFLRGVDGQQVDSSQFSDPHKLLENASLEISGEGYSASSITDDGGYIDLPGLARLNFQRLQALLAGAGRDTEPFSNGRTVDYYVPPPFMAGNSYHIIAPPGYRVKDIAPTPPIALGPLTITTTVKRDADDSLWFTYTIISPKDRLTPKEVDSMRRDTSKIVDKTALRIQLENVASAKMQSGDLLNGLKLLRQDAAAAEDTVNPPLRLAAGYVLVGARTAALKLCQDLLDRQTKINAKGNNASSDSSAANAALAAIYVRLGWINEHDQFGVSFDPGMNLDEAKKNFQQAADLDPSQLGALLQLATLDTYNAAGIQYGRSARLNEAADIYSRLNLNVIVGSGRLNDNALLLLRAHKYTDLHEFFLYPQADSVDQSIKWAAFAASRPESDLKDELEFRVPSARDRRVLLLQAGRQLIAAREYAAASHVLHLAGAGPGLSELELERVNRVKIFDPSTTSAQPAVAAFQNYIQSILDPEHPDDWKDLVTPENQSSTLQAQRASLLQLFQGLSAGPLDSKLWPYLSDLIDTTLTFTVDGSDQIGFRIKFSSGAGDTTPHVIAYVAKRPDKYLVAGLLTSNAPRVQAVANAKSGNVPAARQWLNWAREAANLPPLGEAEFQPALDLASAQLLFDQGKSQEAVPILQRLQQNDPSRTATTILLVEALIRANRFAEAAPLIASLKSNPNVLIALHLQEHLLAQQQKYAEAVALAKQICANPKASFSDWNDLAWITLFTEQPASEALTAAEKAAELSSYNSPEVLQTLAIAQAAAMHLQDARSTAYKFAAVSEDPSEMYTIFGRIAEQLGLLNVASDYYSKVPRADESALSNYSLAQINLLSVHKTKSP